MCESDDLVGAGGLSPGCDRFCPVSWMRLAALSGAPGGLAVDDCGLLPATLCRRRQRPDPGRAGRASTVTKSGFRRRSRRRIWRGQIPQVLACTRLKGPGNRGRRVFSTGYRSHRSEGPPAVRGRPLSGSPLRPPGLACTRSVHQRVSCLSPEGWPAARAAAMASDSRPGAAARMASRTATARPAAPRVSASA